MDNTRTIEKIKKLESKKKTNKVIKFLDSKDVEVVEAAMKALGTIKDEDSVNTVAHMIDSSDPAIRIAAAGCLGEIGTEYCKTYLQHRAHNESDENVKAAITGALHCIAAK